MRRRARLLPLVALSLAACEPSGPGELTASVRTPRPTGAVVVELAGTGITGFDGAGDVRTFSGPVDVAADTQRVVVVSVSGERIRFRVQVRDLGDPPPTAVLMAISFSRDAARDNKRLATLAQAISSTSPTAPNSFSNVGRVSPTTCSCTGVRLTSKFAFVSGCSSLSRPAMVSN